MSKTVFRYLCPRCQRRMPLPDRIDPLGNSLPCERCHAEDVARASGSGEPCDGRSSPPEYESQEIQGGEPPHASRPGMRGRRITRKGEIYGG